MYFKAISFNAFYLASFQNLEIHESLALKIFNEILSDSSDVNNIVLVLVLTMLEISPTDQDNVKHLQVLCGRMIEVRKLHLSYFF